MLSLIVLFGCGLLIGNRPHFGLLVQKIPNMPGGLSFTTMDNPFIKSPFQAVDKMIVTNATPNDDGWIIVPFEITCLALLAFGFMFMLL